MKSSYTIRFLKYRDEWGEGQYYGDSYKIICRCLQSSFFYNLKLHEVMLSVCSVSQGDITGGKA